MRSMLIVLLGLVLCLSGVAAQDDGGYRLREPGAEEYLAALPSIIEQMQSEDTSTYGNDMRALKYMLAEELWLRYDYNTLVSVPYTLLSDARSNIVLDTGFTLEPRSERGWHNLMFNAWLRQTQPALSTQANWTFAGYTLQIQLVDFTGDGIDELLIHMTYPGYEEFFVLAVDGILPEGYRRLGELQLWFSDSCPLQLSCGGIGQIFQIGDLTGDGIPELITVRGMCAWGRCSSGLGIWGWWHGEFTKFSRQSDLYIPVVSGGGGVQVFPPDGDWLFENTDDDPAIEITQVERLIDNRGCEFTTEQIFQWSEETGKYQVEESSYAYADTPWCALRQAHDAMKALDFEAAVQHFEHMLAFEPEPELVDMWHYARVRLAAAYALTEQHDAAAILLDEIPTGAIDDQIIRAMVEAGKTAFTTNQKPTAICGALHNVLDEIDWWTIGDSLLLSYGQNNEYGISLNYGGGDISPANAGCSIDALQETSLETIDAEQPLVAQPENTSLNNDDSDVDLTIVDPLSCNRVPYEFCGNLEHPEEALLLIDEIFAASPEWASTRFDQFFHYYRAIVFETLDRPGDALVEYVTLYESVPDSTWGMLAALHLEPIEQ